MNYASTRYFFMSFITFFSLLTLSLTMAVSFNEKLKLAFALPISASKLANYEYRETEENIFCRKVSLFAANRPQTEVESFILCQDTIAAFSQAGTLVTVTTTAGRTYQWDSQTLKEAVLQPTDLNDRGAIYTDPEEANQINN